MADVEIVDCLMPMGMGMSAIALVEHLYVPALRINHIVLERRGITTDTALRLSSFLAAMLSCG